MDPFRRGLVLLFLAATACGGGDDGGDDNITGTPGTGTTAGDDDDGDDATTPGTPGTTDDTGADDGMAGPPVIEMAAWTQVAGCAEGTVSDVSVVFTVTDPDDAVGDLTFSGIAIGCTGDLDAPEVTLVCPQVAPYGATLTVTDPDGNSDSLMFTIDICADGSAP